MHCRVQSLGGRSVGGLGGIFKGAVWYPRVGDEAPLIHSRAERLSALAHHRRWRKGLPLVARDAIYPEEYFDLAMHSADVLATHEAPTTHPYGFPALTNWVRQCVCAGMYTDTIIVPTKPRCRPACLSKGWRNTSYGSARFEGAPARPFPDGPRAFRAGRFRHPRRRRPPAVTTDRPVRPLRSRRHALRIRNWDGRRRGDPGAGRRDRQFQRNPLGRGRPDLPRASMIYFLDLEASSLRTESYPIEIAWVDETGDGESHLIRPAPGWTDWDPIAEGIHGISRQRLLDEDEDVLDVARRAEAALGHGRATVVASSVWDSTWLWRLLREGGVDASIPVSDFGSCLREACTPLRRLLPPPDAPGYAFALQRIANIAKGVLEFAEEMEALSGRVAHRALPDAENLRATWRSVVQGVDVWLTAESREPTAHELAALGRAPWCCPQSVTVSADRSLETDRGRLGHGVPGRRRRHCLSVDARVGDRSGARPDLDRRRTHFSDPRVAFQRCAAILVDGRRGWSPPGVTAVPYTEILLGDASDRLADLAPESVDCCVTSPPYTALGTVGCPAKSDGRQRLRRTCPASWKFSVAFG